MLNGNEMKAFYRIFFPKRPGESGLAARVPDVNETRLNDNFKTIGDEFRKIWEFIKNGFKTKSLTVDGDASIGGDASVGGQLSAGSAVLGDTNVTGTLDVDGSAKFDSGVTIGGVLDVTQRRCLATLSSTGWYRVMNVNIGNANGSKFSSSAIVDINIGTSYWDNNNGTHKISLHGVFNNASFVGEESKSNYMLIDKVRYTYDPSGNGHIDIHYIGTSGNPVWCSFTVHTTYNNQKFYVAVTPTSVADSPSGETELARYTFSANGTGDLNVNGTVTGQGFADLLFGIGNSIPSNTNCNSLTSEGKYTCYSSAIAGTLTNQPYTDAFGMLVIRVAEAKRLVQVAMPNSSSPSIKIRYFGGTTWTAWKTLTPS